MFGFRLGFQRNHQHHQKKFHLFQRDSLRNNLNLKENPIINIILFTFRLIQLFFKILLIFIIFFLKCLLLTLIIAKLLFSFIAKILFYSFKYLISKIISRLNFKRKQAIKSKRIFIKGLLIIILIHFFFHKLIKH
jgi:hypothetical protein